jgi:phospholipid/cholesterol/gamma-HCH transport system substrate-binding protein
MAQRRAVAWTELRVGILVIASAVMLAVAIFYISGAASPFTPKYRVMAYFASANGLRKGAEVWLEGVTIGNVTDVRVSKQADPRKAVEVDMQLNREFQNIIRTDSQLIIETQGLLGNNIVAITRGTTGGQVVPDGGTLQGNEAGDIKKIISGTNDFIANLDVLSDQFKKMAEKVERGEGTLGAMLSDRSIYNNVDKATSELHALIRDARTGPGTVGKLMNDDELYQRVNASVERLNKMMDYVESGQGTLGKFYKDPSLYTKADNLVGRFQSIADDIDQGKGSMGKLLKDDGFYNDARQTLQRVQSLVASVENGEGSAGKFIKDPTLYNSLNQTSSEILKLLYDFRQNPKKFLTISFKLF